MNSRLKLHIEHLLQKENLKNNNFRWKSISGGSINNTFKIESNFSNFFIKTNTLSVFENGFKEEVLGLQFLNSKKISTPKIIASGIFENYIYLILEWIDSSSENTRFWNNFAQDLAHLHRYTNKQFGLNYSNYMGQLTQKNEFFINFYNFFIENRLKPQVELSINSGFLQRRHLQKFENLYKELPSIFPKEKPSAIHGDLWSGNFMSSNDKVILIDPAVYYGHREIDLAMSMLFGGFSQLFYSHYNNIFPLENGFQLRKNYYNLYPLLIHLNLFGNSYLAPIENIINKF